MPPQKEASTLVLHNCQVVTLDTRNPSGEAVAIQSGRIAWVVGKDALNSLKPGAFALDCGGGTVLPGFIDPHLHLLSYARSLLSVDCSPRAVKSIGDLVVALKKRAAQIEEGEWLAGTGYNEFYLREKRHPNRWDLDHVSTIHPIKLLHRSGHALVLNSMALKLAHIDINTPEPLAGYIERDLATGEPTGFLADLDEWLAERLGDKEDKLDLEKGMRLASERLLAAGVTSMADATASNGPEQWSLFSRLKKEGILGPRLTMMVGYKHLDAMVREGLCFGKGDKELKVGHCKVMLGQAGGALHPSRKELADMVRSAVSQGFPLAFHSVEEDEIEAALRALEVGVGPSKHEALRHRIEHCSVCPPSLQQKIRHLRVSVVTQPGFIYHSGERYLQTVPAEALQSLYPIRSLIEGGVNVAGSSDAPVAPPSPLLAIQAATSRQAQTGELVMPEQAIPIEKALALYTMAAAGALGEEASRGAIIPRKLADLVILSANPLETSAEILGEIEVWGTIINGELVWRKEAAPIGFSPGRRREAQ